MEAKDKLLNFSRCDFQPVLQSNHSPGFTPAAQLYCLNSSLSLQQCLQCWEAAALEATPVTPSPCPARILRPEPNDPLWEREGPIHPLLFLPAGRGVSEGSPAQLPGGDSLQQLPCCHLIRREEQQPMETRTRCSHGPDPSPRVWEHPRDLEPWELTHCSHQIRNPLQQARQELPTPQNGALWSLLLKALYNPSMKCAMKCKALLLSQTKIIFLFFKIPRNFSAFP